MNYGTSGENEVAQADGLRYPLFSRGTSAEDEHCATPAEQCE